MANLNRVFLIGNLTRDPELRYIPNGTAVANVGLAVNRRYKDANGNLQDEVCYVTVVLWGRQAETASQYLKKGSPAFVEGRLQYRTWEQDGKKRSTLEVRCERLQFLGPSTGAQGRVPSDVEGLGGRRGEGEAPAAGEPEDETAEAARTAPSAAPSEHAGDDVPF